jgi:hypothetical protein
MALQRIQAMLDAANTAYRVFPATVLYNENWMLRLTLDWFSNHDPGQHPLRFEQGARWFSEAWLPSAFLLRQRRPRDPLAEGWSHADGVIGHFTLGNQGKADLSLSPTASQLIVLEGKIYSCLSLGVRNAPFYDQAARTVGCMAEVLKRANRLPNDMTSLAFYVIAPRSEIQRGVFKNEVTSQSVTNKVRKRVGEYAGARNDWLTGWFELLLQRPVAIGCLEWETILGRIRESDPSSGDALTEFYQRCLDYNRPANQEEQCNPI